MSARRDDTTASTNVEETDVAEPTAIIYTVASEEVVNHTVGNVEATDLNGTTDLVVRVDENIPPAELNLYTTAATRVQSMIAPMVDEVVRNIGGNVETTDLGEIVSHVTRSEENTQLTEVYVASPTASLLSVVVEEAEFPAEHIVDKSQSDRFVDHLLSAREDRNQPACTASMPMCSVVPLPNEKSFTNIDNNVEVMETDPMENYLVRAEDNSSFMEESNLVTRADSTHSVTTVQVEETVTNSEDNLQRVQSERFMDEYLVQEAMMLDMANSSDQEQLNLYPYMDEVFCRICQDDEYKEPLITPCRCKGSIAFVHSSCLERWLEVSDRSWCELCHYVYKLQVDHKYRKLHSIKIWLQTVADRRHILFDLITLFVVTPFVITGVTLALNAALFYDSKDKYRELYNNTDLTTPGLALLAGTILSAYAIWFVTLCRYHYRQWYNWWNRTLRVRVISAYPETAHVTAY